MTGEGWAEKERGLQRSPMSRSSALRESDLPFMWSRLSRSRDRSLEERSLSLDDLIESQRMTEGQAVTC